MFKSMILEGKLYDVYNFVVGYNNMKFKTTKHKYKLNFMPKTKVVEFTNNNFPSNNYQFKSFGELLGATEVDENELFGEIKICNTYYITKLLVNAPIDEINDFRKRFKLRVRVIDGTGSASFLLWDRECFQLLGKTASELRDNLDEAKTLVERKILFKVQIKSQNINEHDDLYTVMRLTDKNDLISKYGSRYSNENQESDVQSRLEQNDIVELKDSMSDSEGSTLNKTPTKRSYVSKGVCESDNEILTGEPSSQMSSNKIRKIVKQEKE
ncbi:Replication protein A 70 kDa DNA-binding subunit [Abeliophyllum distichum]|uniref:Replication protein A 70 kDa DNA-binding subunit n=1 Tax=Abeliophyllum distichum TaxID=126358 RepID=A0ABD1V2D2_9LAMI